MEIFNEGDLRIMANNDSMGFVDPLENIINKTKDAYGISEETPLPNITSVPNPPEIDDIDISDIVTSQNTVNEVDDDEFGKNDFKKQIEEEERLENERLEMERQRRLEEEQDSQTKTIMPPRSLDKQFQSDAIDLQNEHLAIVTGMVEQVKAKYHLNGRIIPEKTRQVQGDLLELYFNNGSQITPEFEQLILNNWEHIDPDTGEAYAAPDNYNGNVNTSNAQTNPNEHTINITVESNQPVTINMPEDLNAKLEETKANVVKINVREMSESEIRSMTIIENPQEAPNIVEHKNDMCSIPITLPMSAYRCTIRPVNYFEMIDLVAPRSNSKVDFMIQRWEIIYNHMDNISIGKFADFQDFLKKTKYADLGILEWAILTATCDEEEPIQITCGNPKCKKTHDYYYSPRTIIHLNEDNLPKNYHDISNAVGESAVKLFSEINTKRVGYELKHCKKIIEINEPSAYEYLTIKLPLIIAKYAERIPEDPNMDNFNEETLQTGGDPRLNEFAYKMALMMRISAIIVPPPETDNFDTPHEYRFTNWDDIEEQIQLLPMEDTIALIKLVGNHEDFASPIDFYVSDVKCPYCGRVEPQIPVNNLITNLLFRVSRRLQNTEINLIELD
jgi:hypothetical protein